jgi:iron complex transport system permease protein
VLLGLVLLLAASVFVALFIGTLGPIGPGDPVRISFDDAFKAVFYHSGEWSGIFWDVRMPRVLLAALVGAGLACAGTAMQAVFRNPLADPYIIGVSSGAAVGAAAAGLLGLTAAVATSLPPAFAFATALLTVFVVYGLGTYQGRIRVDALLLSGVAVAAFLGAVVSFLIYFAKEQFHQLIFWLLGSLSLATWDVVGVVFVAVLIGTLIVFLHGRDLNVLLLGEETAHNLGIDPEWLKKLMLGVAALVTAAAVAFTGIIGFVGLIVPHMMRLVLGADHRLLVPASTLFGATFLIWSDALARTIVAPTELPVGIITALCGGPFFIYLLRRSRGGEKQ